MTTSVKTCFKCGAERPLADFYRHPRMKDGRLNKCKECNKKDVDVVWLCESCHKEEHIILKYLGVDPDE